MSSVFTFGERKLSFKRGPEGRGGGGGGGGGGGEEGGWLAFFGDGSSRVWTLSIGPYA